MDAFQNFCLCRHLELVRIVHCLCDLFEYHLPSANLPFWTAFSFLHENHRSKSGNTCKMVELADNIDLQIINNYWMRLSGISRIIEAEVGVICRSRRLRQITLTEASIILDIARKPNSIIILLFTWTVLSFTWTILLFTWADTKIMI